MLGRTLVILCCVSACQGTIAGGELPGRDGAGGGSAPDVITPTDPTDPTQVDECATVTDSVGVWPLQRLTSRQLDRTVSEVLFDQTHAMKVRLVAADEVVNSRLRYELAQTANPVVAEGLILAAEDVSNAAMTATQLNSQLACTATDAAGKRLCAGNVVTTLGRRLWRRTLTAADRTTLMAVYDTAIMNGTHLEAVQSVLHALLASPDFFFFQQPPASGQITGTILAERLAYTLWQSPPDDQLITAAESGALDSQAGLTEQINRMMADPRADESLSDFLKHWLAPEKTVGIDRALAAATRSPALYPTFKAPSDGADGDAMNRALDGYLAATARAQTGSFKQLLLTPKLAVNEAVARNLGLAQPTGAIVELRNTDSPRRVGVFGQPAFLTAFGRFESSDPVHRGVFLLRQALCQDLPPPDASVNTNLPPATEFLTTRDRFTTATIDPNCAGCHKRINPLGFSFENFDAVGKFRDNEGGHPVSATANIPLVPGGDTVPVDGLGDLATVLADNTDIRNCLVRQYASFALKRALTQGEYCSLKRASSGFAGNDGDFQFLLRGLLTSAPFAQPGVQ